MPSPPSERSRERSPWAKRSNILREQLGQDAEAVVPDAKDHLFPFDSRR